MRLTRARGSVGAAGAAGIGIGFAGAGGVGVGAGVAGVSAAGAGAGAAGVVAFTCGALGSAAACKGELTTAVAAGLVTLASFVVACLLPVKLLFQLLSRCLIASMNCFIMMGKSAVSARLEKRAEYSVVRKLKVLPQCSCHKLICSNLPTTEQLTFSSHKNPDQRHPTTRTHHSQASPVLCAHQLVVSQTRHAVQRVYERAERF